MSIDEYLESQPEGRREIMYALHNAIISQDETVEPVVEPMMGKEMIVYKERSYMKYGLSGVKNYMSVHCMPIYCNPALHERYARLFPGAKFQKGCINFKSAAEIPVEIAANLFADCASVSIADMIEMRNKK